MHFKIYEMRFSQFPGKAGIIGLVVALAGFVSGMLV